MTISPFSQTRILLSFLAILAFCAGSLHAAPLENGFEPSTGASPGEARLRVLAAAQKYEHTPYRYGGLDRRGLDCSGLVYLSFYDALGVTVPRNTQGLYSWVEKITMDNANPGDLVFFKTTGNGNISHVGIFVGNGRFIHAASEGPVTGVIYSSLDERYWSRTYAGTGRVLPEADAGGYTGDKNGAKGKTSAKKQQEAGKILIGFAAAPTWNTYFADGNVLRGAAGQIRLGVVVRPFGQQMILGVEARPEWDMALGVFRLPFTLSWGISDKFRIFAGPALSFGDAALNVSGESRRYRGGTNWIGAAGITVAPFSFKVAGNDLSPYGELAWQSYYSSSSERNLSADIAAGIRFSTGLRYTWRR